jgi:uncharacterized protein
MTQTADWPRPVVHWEIVARNPEGLATFYRQLFHWQIGEGGVMQVAPGLGGPEPGPAGHLRAGDRPGISLYVQVRNLEESLGLAETLGGRLLRAPFDAPTGTTLAIILDPEGNRLVLVQQ